MKLLGLMIIALSATAAGMLVCSAMKSHASELLSITRITELFYSEINCFDPPVTELVTNVYEAAKDEKSAYLLKKCIDEIKLSDFPNAVKAAKTCKSIDGYISRDEYEHFFTFLSKLGTSDTESQLSLCKYYNGVFSRLALKTEKYADTHCRLYFTLIITAALTIGIFLI